MTPARICLYYDDRLIVFGMGPSYARPELATSASDEARRPRFARHGRLHVADETSPQISCR